MKKKNVTKKNVIKKDFKIQSKFNNGVIVDDWYVYTSNDMYSKIFGQKLKASKYYPWKRKVVEIYSSNTSCKVYRIWRGVPMYHKSAGMIFVSPTASRILAADEEVVELKLAPSKKWKFYWNHFEASVRCSFKLGFISVLAGVISLIVSVGSLIIAFQ